MGAVLALFFVGPAFASDPDGFQENEQPGSEIEIDIGAGKATIERKSGAPVFKPGDVPMTAPGAGTQLEFPNDPDTPAAPDPVDAELPGEGPEDLSGPDDDDPLPE
jgi:hypothetical protein